MDVPFSFISKKIRMRKKNGLEVVVNKNGGLAKIIGEFWRVLVEVERSKEEGEFFDALYIFFFAFTERIKTSDGFWMVFLILNQKGRVVHCSLICIKSSITQRGSFLRIPRLIYSNAPRNPSSICPIISLTSLPQSPLSSSLSLTHSYSFSFSIAMPSNDDSIDYPSAKTKQTDHFFFFSFD